ncbi:MAG TPA: helix-turn-helix transcriptional regulator [Ktedonobacterales bacterium]|jgi:transcriptional regulator with XRE-family HTH domain|nr:helix-turn-helix transcriptional regulator [Ktedonobacterales bacterium]
MPTPTSRCTVPALRYHRLHRLLTQEQVAAAAAVSVPTIIRAEGGKPVGALTAEKLARALGVSVRQLRETPPEE